MYFHWFLVACFSLFLLTQAILPNEEANAKIQEGFRQAVQHYKEHTCIRFIKRQPYHHQYIYFHKGFGCSSHIGPNGGVRKVSLDPNRGCYKRDVIVHEVMHALGFWHEQSRPDRDNYITIVWENVPQSARNNFRKYGRDKIDSLGVDYDLRSIMHYSQSSFTSRNRFTIKTKDPKLQHLLNDDRSNVGLSALDIKQIRLLYKCNGNNPVTGGPTMPSCIDYQDQCARYKDYCSRPKTDALRKWVDEQCRKTCGICT
ncbi:zinc metalloproteinase nas-6-like [Hydractinia symbiolongicarpus]|uniref:zinc metalloproteinase nas-6-like n=1 Tax=Hydractinia symbiolongicarpus TaxID=13093 RepID=UPI00254F2F87|nr:zinc metalloproteinase nas-6-like [Hydractinia symbiolongicarpus]